MMTDYQKINLIKSAIYRNSRFHKFLVKHKIMGKFIKNTIVNKDDDEIKQAAHSIRYDTAYSIISCSFSWIDTDEGDDFWRKYAHLHDKEINVIKP